MRCVKALLVWTVGLGLGLGQSLPFRDVSPTLEGIRFLYERGIIQGYPDGTFRGEEYATREQVALMLYRAYLAFADDVARRVKDALAREGEARLEEALSAVQELREATGIVQEALKKVQEETSGLQEGLALQGEEIRTLRKEIEDLAEDLARLSSGSLSREEIGDLISSVGALEGLIAKVERRLSSLEEKAKSLEEALKSLEGKVQASSGEVNKKVYDLTGRVDALEERLEKAPKLSLGVSVGLSEGKPEGAVDLRAEADGIRLLGRISPSRLKVRAEDGALSLTGVSREEGSEVRGEYRLFKGVGLALGAGYGDAPFGLAKVVHDAEGGLIPGLFLEAGGGIGFHEGNLSRNLLFLRGGFQFGGALPSIGYYRLRNEKPFSLLEGRLDWSLDIGLLEAFYRFVAFRTGERGGDLGVRFTSRSNPFVELGVRRANGVSFGEPASFTFPYLPTKEVRTAFTVRVGWMLDLGVR